MPADRLARGAPPGQHANLLIRSLQPGDLRLLAPYLTRVFIEAGEPLIAPGVPLARTLFPETGIVGIQEGPSVDRRSYVGMVGFEGMVGWSALLGSEHSSLRAVAQMAGGTALAIDTMPLQVACRISLTLNAALLRFVHNFMGQMASTIVSNTADPVERRVARWLLMLHDRSEGEQMRMTHDYLSGALNVRRASITDCLHVLEGQGLLRCLRGTVIIRDRAALELVAGDSYGQVERRYATEIAPFGRSSKR